MNRRLNRINIRPLPLLQAALLSLLFCGCDFIAPKKKYRLAVPEQDYSYNYAASHLKGFLQQGEFDIEIITVSNVVEANEMVSNGTADLTFVLNHSMFIPGELGEHSGKLRTILPLCTRLMFFFGQEGLESQSIHEEFRNKTIGVEVAKGETETNLREMFRLGAIDSVSFSDNTRPDLIHFWGTFYGERAKRLQQQGWESISLDDDWIEFLLLNNPALRKFTLPGIPGMESHHMLNTVATETLLVGSSHLGENAVHELSQYIFQHRLKLLGYDRMYLAVNEHFDQETLLYPLHAGTDAYLRRDEPSFLERYSDALALFVSILAIIYGGIQAAKNRLAQRKKDQVDIYFIDFLKIKEATELDSDTKEQRYDELLHKILLQMTDEKLDKSDFHILSRLIQQELTNLKFKEK